MNILVFANTESYVADELIISRAGKRVRVGNTDAEGRMAMADCLCEMKEKVIRMGKRNQEFPQIGQRYRIKNKAAIALQCKSNVKLIAALLFILPCFLYWSTNVFHTAFTFFLIVM